MKDRNQPQGGPAKKKLDIDQNVLSLFWDLASLEKGVREKAASNLVDKVIAEHKTYTKQPKAQEAAAPSGADNHQQKQLTAILAQCSPTGMYTLRRLIQGLASSRKGARQGFAAALTVLLERADWIKPSEVVAVIKLLLTPAGSAKKSEAKDMLIGQLFGFGSVIRAYKRLDASVSINMAERLLKIADKRTFLRQAAYSLLLDLTGSMKDADLKQVFDEVESLQSILKEPADKATPESLLLALRLWARMPSDIAAACPLLPPTPSSGLPSSLWTSGATNYSPEFAAAAAAMLSEEHITVLLPVLRLSTSSHPRLHSVWHCLLAMLMPGYSADGSAGQENDQQQQKTAQPMDTAQLKALWTLAVETDIFSSASHERKYLGFLLFRTILPRTQPNQVSILLSPSFLRTLSNNLTKKDTYLHASAKKCVESIQSVRDQADTALKGALLAALQHSSAQAVAAMLKNESPKVDAKANEPKQTEEAAAGLTSSSSIPAHVKELSAAFMRVSAEIKKVEEGSQAEHKWQSVLNQLSAVVKKPDVAPGVKQTVLNLLAGFAYGPTIDKPSAKQQKLLTKHGISSYIALPTSFREWCASRVIVLADNCSKAVPPRGKAAVTAGADANGTDAAAAPVARYDHLKSTVEFVQDLYTSGASKGDQEDSNVYQSWSELRSHLTSLEAATKDTTTHNRIKALLHLVSLVELYVLVNKSFFEADLASDLERICEQALSGNPPPQPSPPSEEDDDENATTPYWMDVLVDALLSLLASSSSPLPSAPVRDAAERVFKAFCEDLTIVGLSDMLDVLGRTLETSKEDEEEQEEQEEEEGESEEMDVEEDGNESEEEDEERDDDDDQEEASDKEEDEESEDEGATDQHMFQMDEKLAAYFSSMRVDRQGKKTQQQELVNFKLRVLACLEAFIKKVPESPLLPLALDPLLSALVASAKPGSAGNQVLAERLAGIIQHKLCKSKAEAAGADVEEDDLKELLHRSLYLASRSEDKSVASAAGAAYVYMQRVAIGSGKGAGDALPAVALESLNVAIDDYFNKKKSRLSHNLMVDLMRRVPQVAAASLEKLVKEAASGRNEFVKLEAFALAEAALLSVRGSFADMAGELSSSISDMILAGVKGPYSKVQKHMQALKSCQQFAAVLKEKCGGASTVLSTAEMKAITSAVSELKGNNKLEAQAKRLLDVLQHQAAVKGKGSKRGAQKEAPVKVAVKKSRPTTRSAAKK